MKSFQRRAAFTLIELLVVMGIMVLLISILLPAISHVRTAAFKERLGSDIIESVSAPPDVTGQARSLGPLATIKSFQAFIGLTPQLSVGTAEPESIYQATFHAILEAQAAPMLGINQPGAAQESEIELPLPPQIISLGDLTVLVNGQPSDAMSLRNDKLVWHGPLADASPARLDVTYTAVGKGLYSLQTPPSRILDQFKIELTAHGGSDVRMLELSLQPTSLNRSADLTTYVWDYKRLMFGRPIALDVLGIAPIDRLGELRWLGPISVIAFGIVLGLVARAFQAANFDRWMLLLVVGMFTGAYPLMYFAQEFITLRIAMLVVGGAVLLLIAIRVVTLMGLRLGLLGVTAPAAAIMALALAAATHPNLQGILLTILGLGLFALGMMLAPRLQPTSRLHIPPFAPAM